MANTRRANRKNAASRKANRKGSRKANRKAERKSRKQEGGKSEWNKAVMRVYQEMKRKDRSASFGDALKEASKRKKAGNL